MTSASLSASDRASQATTVVLPSPGVGLVTAITRPPPEEPMSWRFMRRNSNASRKAGSWFGAEMCRFVGERLTPGMRLRIVAPISSANSSSSLMRSSKRASSTTRKRARMSATAPAISALRRGLGELRCCGGVARSTSWTPPVCAALRTSSSAIRSRSVRVAFFRPTGRRRCGQRGLQRVDRTLNVGLRGLPAKRDDLRGECVGHGGRLLWRAPLRGHGNHIGLALGRERDRVPQLVHGRRARHPLLDARRHGVQ